MKVTQVPGAIVAWSAGGDRDGLPSGFGQSRLWQCKVWGSVVSATYHQELADLTRDLGDTESREGATHRARGFGLCSVNNRCLCFVGMKGRRSDDITVGRPSTLGEGRMALDSQTAEYPTYQRPGSG